jgi:hypothetical protein
MSGKAEKNVAKKTQNPLAKRARNLLSKTTDVSGVASLWVKRSEVDGMANDQV